MSFRIDRRFRRRSCLFRQPRLFRRPGVPKPIGPAAAETVLAFRERIRFIRKSRVAAPAQEMPQQSNVFQWGGMRSPGFVLGFQVLRTGTELGRRSNCFAGRPRLLANIATNPANKRSARHHLGPQPPSIKPWTIPAPPLPRSPSRRSSSTRSRTSSAAFSRSIFSTTPTSSPSPACEMSCGRRVNRSSWPGRSSSRFADFSSPSPSTHPLRDLWSQAWLGGHVAASVDSRHPQHLRTLCRINRGNGLHDIPHLSQLLGLSEVVSQSLLLSIILCYWVNHPDKRWLNWVLGAAFVIILTLPILGLLVGRRQLIAAQVGSNRRSQRRVRTLVPSRAERVTRANNGPFCERLSFLLRAHVGYQNRVQNPSASVRIPVKYRNRWHVEVVCDST